MPLMQRRPPRLPPMKKRIDDAVVMFHCTAPLKKWCVLAAVGRIVHS